MRRRLRRRGRMDRGISHRRRDGGRSQWSLGVCRSGVDVNAGLQQAQVNRRAAARSDRQVRTGVTSDTDSLVRVGPDQRFGSVERLAVGSIGFSAGCLASDRFTGNLGQFHCFALLVKRYLGAGDYEDDLGLAVAVRWRHASVCCMRSGHGSRATFRSPEYAVYVTCSDSDTTIFNIGMIAACR